MLFCSFLCTAFASLTNPKNLLKQPIRAALIISDLPFFNFLHYSGIKASPLTPLLKERGTQTSF